MKLIGSTKGKIRTMAMAFAVVSLIVAASAAVADNGDRGSRNLQEEGFAAGPPRGHRPPPMNLGMPVGDAVHDTLAASVLAELTGQTAEEIAAAMAETHLPELMESYGIEKEAFKTAMDTAVEAWIGNAVAAGLISETAADKALERLANRPEPPRPPRLEETVEGQEI